MALTQSIYEAQQVLTWLQYKQWRDVLFSVQWWVLVFILIGSWLIWLKFVDKGRGFEILSYALIVIITGTTINDYGVKLGLWAYPIKIFYLNPGLIAGDWAMPPLLKSLAYQYFPDWKRFVLAQTVIAAGFAFIGESFLVWIGAYQMYGWSYGKSFPIYLLVAVLAKFVIDGVKKYFCLKG